ncbi:MAG: RlmF-related methyltransferase [Fluviicola sp.]|nr:RlmF-related methyltransferase [Fluviicola sp.]
MPPKTQPQEKIRLHPRNKNRERYDLDALKISTPELKNHISFNKFRNESIDFSNPLAVKYLNRAWLLAILGVGVEMIRCRRRIRHVFCWVFKYEVHFSFHNLIPILC